jgi:hypothetical protein
MKRIWILLVVICSLSACLKKKDLPDVPVITSQSFEIAGDSAILRLNFSDGDGNFGLEDGDTTGVFSPCLRRKFNLYAEYYELQNGQWVHEYIDPCDEVSDDDVPFYNRVPWIKPTGQNQAQEGEIKIVMQDWYLISEFDTIKFEVKIVDRDMQESNTVTVGPYVKQ